MTNIRWEELFTTSYPVNGASEDQILRLSSSLSDPLSEEEIASINDTQKNPFPASDPLYRSYKPFDPRLWKLPTRPLPPMYLSFLRWSNGGSFFAGETSFDPFFSTSEVRDYLVGYNVPQYMPDAVPFAFDGGARFYLFDMREEPVADEYPILIAGAGDLGYDDYDSRKVATCFIEACRGAPFA